tara:strand:+ start:1812 stop:2015 length:204 start_codon:yes stop_codon:yes gene_type:complete
MNRIVRMLEEMKVKQEQEFISNSLIKRASVIDSPAPDVDSDLERIVELNEAISVLNNHLMQKPNQRR